MKFNTEFYIMIGIFVLVAIGCYFAQRQDNPKESRLPQIKNIMYGVVTIAVIGIPAGYLVKFLSDL